MIRLLYQSLIPYRPGKLKYANPNLYLWHISSVRFVLDLFDELRFPDGGVQLLQKESAAFAFFHLGDRIGYGKVVTGRKKDVIEIAFNQMTPERLIGSQLV